MSPADIAKKLTPAQKRALLWLPDDGAVRGQPGRMGAALTSLRGVYPALVKVSWQHSDDAHIYAATPLGHEVRAILAGEPTP